MSMAEMVHEALSQTQGVTDFYTARGTHEGCGQCCGRFLPLFPHEVVELRHLAKRTGVRPEVDGAVDMNCPLLGEDMRCMAYESRPTICRAYDCSRHAAEGMAFAMSAADMGLEPGMTVYDMREVCR